MLVYLSCDIITIILLKKEKMQMDNWDIIIKPKSKWYEIDFKSLIEYKDLIALFVRRNFVVQYKQTLLGPLWVLITPLLNSIVFTFVFG